MTELIAPANYLLLQEFLHYLEKAFLVCEETRGRYESYLRLLLRWASGQLFEHAPLIEPSFPQFLLAYLKPTVEKPLSASTMEKAAQLTRRFFEWARVEYPTRFRTINPHWIATIRIPERERNKGKGESEEDDHVFISLEEALGLLRVPGDPEDIDLLRDQAAAALMFVSGARPGAFATLPIHAVDIGGRKIRQHPKLGVHTKFSKSATTYLLDIPELLETAQRWDDFIRPRLPETAMWYTPIKICWGEHTLSAERPGKHRNGALAGRMAMLFARAGLEYKTPHKFRHGHAVYALRHARSMADYKAVSQNLMHESINTTDGIYARLLGSEIQDRIDRLMKPETTVATPDGELTALLESFSRADQAKALMILAARLANS